MNMCPPIIDLPPPLEKQALVAQCLSHELLDAILANVEMTRSLQCRISRKLPGDHRDHSSRFKVKTFVLTFLQKLRKSIHGNSRYFSLKVVNRHGPESSGCDDMTNFNNRNKVN